MAFALELSNRFITLPAGNVSVTLYNERQSLFRLFIPANFSGTRLSVSESIDGGNTIWPLRLTDGTIVVLTAFPGSVIDINPDAFPGTGPLRFTSDVAQVADCVLVAVTGRK